MAVSEMVMDATDDRQRAARDWTESQGYPGVLRALNGEELTDMTLVNSKIIHL